MLLGILLKIRLGAENGEKRVPENRVPGRGGEFRLRGTFSQESATFVMRLRA